MGPVMLHKKSRESIYSIPTDGAHDASSPEAPL